MSNNLSTVGELWWGQSDGPRGSELPQWTRTWLPVQVLSHLGSDFLACQVQVNSASCGACSSKCGSSWWHPWELTTGLTPPLWLLIHGSCFLLRWLPSAQAFPLENESSGYPISARRKPLLESKATPPVDGSLWVCRQILFNL